MKAFPFDSRIVSTGADGLPVYDRASSAAEFAALYKAMFSNGLFGSPMCEVLADGGMTATIGAGSMLIEGRFGLIDSTETVVFEGAEGLDRIDTVVLRLDLSSDVNFIVPAVKRGTAASAPVRPSLTRDGTVWELGIADVLVPANSTAISQQHITDTRLENARCGLVAAVLADIDTTHLYDQIRADLAYFKQVEQADFEAWFASLESLLDENVAANLAAEIEKKAEMREEAVTLPAAGWPDVAPFTQTVAVTGVTVLDAVVVAPAPVNHTEYAQSGVYCSAQAADALTFTCSAPPDADLVVNVMLIR